jgi:putative hydrolase of the HAD superfamily
MAVALEQKIPPGQNLLIDADDTLWENNIYFEQAIARFISFLDHKTHTPEEVRLVLWDVEREVIRQHGYGMHSFASALVGCFERLSLEPVTPQLHEQIKAIAYKIAEHPMELMPEVPETLDYLSRRHRLFMVTKGNFTEQTGKLQRSELQKHFTGVEVLTEKNAPAYREVVEKYGLLHEQTWMIGNSPSSDINPALEAGLHAVFVPHHNTWELERGEILHSNADRKLLHVESFGYLRQIF